MIKMARLPPKNPLIAIIGTTGTGKSQLAIDLALRFNGEIVNSDAVQLYEGLPIVTNKVRNEERKGVPHHLIGCIGRREPTWRVDAFVDNAIRTIRDIRRRNCLPILVGGTHYYTQSLLFNKILAGGKIRKTSEEPDNHTSGDSHDHAILQASNEEMLSKLREVDPVMASRWHPNDRRKIQRSLEIWLKTGRRASDIYAEQQKNHRNQNEGQKSSGVSSDEEGDISGLRFPTLLLWTHTPRDVLKERLDGRVDRMVEEGLLDEAEELHRYVDKLLKSGEAIDQTRGLYISIGYKEFKPYFDALNDGSLENNEELFSKLKMQGIDQTKSATWRYAKYQLRWLRIKLVNALKQVDGDKSTFVLDTTNPEEWGEAILKPAVELSQLFLQHGTEALPDTYSFSAAVEDTLIPLRDFDVSQRPDTWRKRTCEICNVTATMEHEWSKHLNSNRHRKTVKYKEKKEALQIQRDLNGRYQSKPTQQNQ